MIFVLVQIENIVGKGENANRPAFSVSHIVFEKHLPHSLQKSGLYGKGLKV